MRAAVNEIPIEMEVGEASRPAARSGAAAASAT